MKRKQIGLQRLAYVTMALILVFLLFPVYWMVVIALETDMEIYKYPLTLTPSGPTVSSFRSPLMVNNQFFVCYKDNFIISDSAVLTSTCVALVSSCALSRFHFKWNRWILVGLLSSQVLPVISHMISLYGLFGRIDLINTRVGLILAVVATQIPFCTILMSNFHDAIPRELEEMATVDGSKRSQTLFQVIVPLVRSGILVVGIYSFLTIWDDYLHAATLVQTDVLRTLPIGITLRYLDELSHD